MYWDLSSVDCDFCGSRVHDDSFPPADGCPPARTPQMGGARRSRARIRNLAGAGRLDVVCVAGYVVDVVEFFGKG